MEINDYYKYLDKINDFKHEKKKNRLKNTSEEELKNIRQNKITINLPKEINT